MASPNTRRAREIQLAPRVAPSDRLFADCNTASDRKALGAFYTDAQVADFLVWWAIRRPQDTVLDPSFGRGVFLRSACERLLGIGGNPAVQVYGIEIDGEVYSAIAPQLQEGFGVSRQKLIHSDFFALTGSTAPRVDVVIGNPPFIRFQRFAGEARTRALRRAAEQGLKLSELSSSWLPFLIHSIGLLRDGGRLAVVIPVEISHAAYARPVLEHLSKQFAQTTFLGFREKLFPDLSEDTLLLLAEGKASGGQPAQFRWRDLANPGALGAIRCANDRTFQTRVLPTDAIASGRERLVEYWIPNKARELYRELKELETTRPLGAIADVGIGYVTGANDFFHLNEDAVRIWDIPREFLRPAVRRGRSLTGVLFTKQDWRAGLKTGESGYLLRIRRDQDLPAGLRRYLAHGEVRGVSRTFKCRTRSPWFSVPHVYDPDAFLSYMSGNVPSLVANDAGAVAPNSLHILRLHHGVSLNSHGLAVLWQTSLSALSAEIEGHALGGGMLKLEPTEAENVLIPWPVFFHRHFADLAREMNALARKGLSSALEHRGNTEVLQKGLGLTAKDCGVLSAAAVQLRSRRMGRSAHR
jgi:adenine-specific DNA-methyltransferase